ncbi:hypothetical protein KEM56_002871, partial [Ascosphaera pollenicola]
LAELAFEYHIRELQEVAVDNIWSRLQSIAWDSHPHLWFDVVKIVARAHTFFRPVYLHLIDVGVEFYAEARRLDLWEALVYSDIETFKAVMCRREQMATQRRLNGL